MAHGYPKVSCFYHYTAEPRLVLFRNTVDHDQVDKTAFDQNPNFFHSSMEILKK